jgi:hypothetical protein
VLTRAFDPIFAKYAGRLPVAYMRALAKRESNLNPSEADDPAWGLMQVIPTVLKSYNKRRGTDYAQRDLLDADTNVKIASDLLNRITVAFDKHRDPNMKMDWSNPEYVALVTAGWNSGYSEAAGVGHVASYLERNGIPVTHDNVFRYAGAAGGTRHLQNDAKRRWQKTVVSLYLQQPDRPRAGGLLALAFVGFIAWGAYKLYYS